MPLGPSSATQAAQQSGGRPRRPTVTAPFGSSRRESHDASGFYERFTAPELSGDSVVKAPSGRDVLHLASAISMPQVETSSVALVVTSPPYFAGKAYEEDLSAHGVPSTYLEYLKMLEEVFAECARVLEPGGRIAVNVANLGRRPFRSLAGDVTDVLQRLGLLLRGEVVWWKGRAAGGSCAWGTFQRPGNPVLRDVTERIVIASKGRFDRALSAPERHAQDLPSTTTISREEFLEATTDLWEIPPESATRVGHPAPFPLALPTRLIELYTYEGDLVLDPFMGSGTTAVAALRTGRSFLGFDTDPGYVLAATARIEDERRRLLAPVVGPQLRVAIPAVAGPADESDDQARSVREGRAAKDVALGLLEACGFRDIRPGYKPRGLGVEISFVAADACGGDWAFDVSGTFTATRAGLKRAETLWKAIGKAAVVHEADVGLPLVLLSTDAPTRGSAGYQALAVMRGSGKPVFDVIELLNPDHQVRLSSYATSGRPDR